MLTPMEWSALRLSLVVATCAVAASLPFAVAAGYALARGTWRGKWLVETLLNLPLVLPPVVTGYGLLVLLGRNGLVGAWLHGSLGLRVAFTTLGAVVAAGVVSFPLMLRAIRLAFDHVDPRLEGAARSLGAGRLAVFFTVSLPLAARGVLMGAVLAFGRSLGEFGATIMLAGNIPGETRTIPLAVFSLAQRPGGVAASWRLVALSVLLAALALGLSEWLQRRGRRS
jgi:molybdate transport system permease protein